ncbi:histone-lysine N-methyltransferase SETMAR-like [Tetranychus urticae]|uniref:histone-lysine N-methyltransferase SETMAR-like n=1 Tax=Tetranychus urticae TaxID=32264 RepID=UPI00077BD29B|nr:histone-lysine N-methyltransferase SETMAR-like [Tetranychus urticae]
MNREKYRETIRALYASGHSIEQIHEILLKAHGNNCPSISTIQRWFREFKWGHQSIADKPRSGRPKEVRTDETIRNVQKFVKDNGRISTREISARFELSHETARTILRNDLDLQKMNARWVPKTLSLTEKRRRVAIARSTLAEFGDEWENFLSRIVTGDETWVSYETPESRLDCAEWLPRGSKPPEIPKIRNERRKIMATIFWDCEGILLIKVMPKGTTINSDSYCQILDELRENIKEKRRGKLRSKVILLHDNARPHTSQATRTKISELGFQPLDHPPYSPDLAPSDYFLFKNLKYSLKGKRFDSETEVTNALNAFFRSKSPEWYRSGISSLKSRLERCIKARGAYFD